MNQNSTQCDVLVLPRKFRGLPGALPVIDAEDISVDLHRFETLRPIIVKGANRYVRSVLARRNQVESSL